MSIRIQGEIEVDRDRGVLYFHNYVNGGSTLRICGLKKELKKFTSMTQIDITVAEHPIPAAGAKAALVMRTELKAPKASTFILNEKHTTHITKAQARRERLAAKGKI